MLLIFSVAMIVVGVVGAVFYTRAYLQTDDRRVRESVWLLEFMNGVVGVMAWFAYAMGVYEIGVPKPNLFGTVIVLGFAGFTYLLVKDARKAVKTHHERHAVPHL